MNLSPALDLCQREGDHISGISKRDRPPLPSLPSSAFHVLVSMECTNEQSVCTYEREHDAVPSILLVSVNGCFCPCSPSRGLLKQDKKHEFEETNRNPRTEVQMGVSCALNTLAQWTAKFERIFDCILRKRHFPNIYHLCCVL